MNCKCSAYLPWPRRLSSGNVNLNRVFPLHRYDRTVGCKLKGVPVQQPTICACACTTVARHPVVAKVEICRLTTAATRDAGARSRQRKHCSLLGLLSARTPRSINIRLQTRQHKSIPKRLLFRDDTAAGLHRLRQLFVAVAPPSSVLEQVSMRVAQCWHPGLCDWRAVGCLCNVWRWLQGVRPKRCGSCHHKHVAAAFATTAPASLQEVVRILPSKYNWRLVAWHTCIRTVAWGDNHC